MTKVKILAKYNKRSFQANFLGQLGTDANLHTFKSGG
jgi:hypothetical protein